MEWPSLKTNDAAVAIDELEIVSSRIYIEAR